MKYGLTGETILYRVITTIFFASGFAALIYQIVWQRALFTIFGINVEAVTIVVTGFLLGLGFGSLSGGWLSHTSTIPLLVLFGLIEIAIGVLGAISLYIFNWVGIHTTHLPVIAVTTATLVLVITPALFMGATLPLLTQHFVRRRRHVGLSVGLLYCINTLGSATAGFVSAFGLMRTLGMQNSIRVAAGINILVGITGLCLAYWHSRKNHVGLIGNYTAFEERKSVSSGQKPRLLFALIVSLLMGYISLSYEVVWFRAFLIGTNQSQAFALILGTYLAGHAVGSFLVWCYFSIKVDKTQIVDVLCIAILMSSVLGVLVLPLAAQVASFGGWDGFVSSTLGLIFAQTGIAGIGFPLLCHAGVTPDDRAGLHLSLVYVSNILGSTAGIVITGFFLMDRMSTVQISVFLATLGSIAAAAVAGLARMSWLRRAAFVAVALILVICGPFAIEASFDHYYDRIIYKDRLGSEPPFTDVVENKSGVIAVNTEGMVYGGGMYDGRVSVDLANDKNGLIRPLSVALYHPLPRDVLMVGLGTGAWAQVLVNNPEIKRLTIIEINPGYLGLIAKYPAVRTVLTNSKVEIIIDDGRRWMNRHPDRKFDVIVQNTTFSFRANVTNLISTEYLGLSARHLREGGVLMYNTTDSLRAQRTGCMMFRYALRELNLIVASNEPLQMDSVRLRAVLDRYSIDGNPVFDRSSPIHRARLEEIIATVSASALDREGQEGIMESCESIKSHTQDLQLITDDNMGEEWEQTSIRSFTHSMLWSFRKMWNH